MASLVIVLVLALGGCVPFIGGREQSRQLATAAQDLVEIAEAREGEVDWLGLRDPAGVQTEETKVLDDYLLSALMKTEVAVGLVDTTGKRWRDEELVGLKQGGRAALALGGRLAADAPWMYVRMFLVERKVASSWQLAPPASRSGTCARNSPRASSEPARAMVQLKWICT